MAASRGQTVPQMLRRLSFDRVDASRGDHIGVRLAAGNDCGSPARSGPPGTPLV
jgi:hypothetical protein